MVGDRGVAPMVADCSQVHIRCASSRVVEAATAVHPPTCLQFATPVWIRLTVQMLWVDVTYRLLVFAAVDLSSSASLQLEVVHV